MESVRQAVWKQTTLGEIINGVSPDCLEADYIR